MQFHLDMALLSGYTDSQLILPLKRTSVESLMKHKSCLRGPRKVPVFGQDKSYDP